MFRIILFGVLSLCLFRLIELFDHITWRRGSSSPGVWLSNVLAVNVSPSRHTKLKQCRFKVDSTSRR